MEETGRKKGMHHEENKGKEGGGEGEGEVVLYDKVAGLSHKEPRGSALCPPLSTMTQKANMTGLYGRGTRGLL